MCLEHKLGPNVFWELILRKWNKNIHIFFLSFPNKMLKKNMISFLFVFSPSVLDYYKNQKKEDKHLIQTIAASIKTHNYHSKAYINRKYSNVL